MSRRGRVRDMQVRVGRTVMTKRGAARFDWRDPYHLAVGLHWWQFIAAVLAAELLLNLFFGALYLLQPGSVANMPAGSFAYAFFFSIETLATVGYGVMAPQTKYGHIVSSFEIVTGMAFTAVTTGLLFVRFARPRPNLRFARNAVVTRHDGRRSLMLRVGNARASALANATAQLTVLLREYTAEGKMFGRMHELRLERSRLPVFAMTWMLIHEIGNDSPLAGYDSERLVRADARLFLSIEALDPVLAATVHDMYVYEAAEVTFGMRFADSVSWDTDGRITVDYTRLHDLEPDSADS